MSDLNLLRAICNLLCPFGFDVAVVGHRSLNIVIDSKVYVVFQVAFGSTHCELVNRFTKV